MGRPLGRFRQGSAGAGPGQDHRRVLRAPNCGPGPGRQGGEERERGVGSQRVPGRTDGDGQGAVWRQGLPRESHPPTYLPYLLPLFLSHPLFLTRNFIDDGKKKNVVHTSISVQTNKQTNKQDTQNQLTTPEPPNSPSTKCTETTSTPLYPPRPRPSTSSAPPPPAPSRACTGPGNSSPSRATRSSPRTS